MEAFSPNASNVLPKLFEYLTQILLVPDSSVEVIPERFGLITPVRDDFKDLYIFCLSCVMSHS